MILETLRAQNMPFLRNSVIAAYMELRKTHTCMCEKCLEGLAIGDLGAWHPELNETDAWKIVRLLENYGAWDCSWDFTLYTFTFVFYTDGKTVTVTHDGATFPQAVCNAFMTYFGLLYNYKYTIL